MFSSAYINCSRHTFIKKEIIIMIDISEPWKDEPRISEIYNSFQFHRCTILSLLAYNKIRLVTGNII